MTFIQFVGWVLEDPTRILALVIAAILLVIGLTGPDPVR